MTGNAKASREEKEGRSTGWLLETETGQGSDGRLRRTEGEHPHAIDDI